MCDCRVKKGKYYHLFQLYKCAFKSELANVLFFFFFVEYIAEDAQKRPEHVGGLLYYCILLYLTVTQLLE